MLKIDEKKTLFISDLHLDESQPETFNLFKELVGNLDGNIDGLYILGDFFEAWIGDDNQTDFNNNVIALLRSLKEKNIPLYIMHGNRDFLLGKKFIKEANATYLPEATKINIYTTPVVLMHGDTLCTDDHAYQRARKFMRNRFLQFLFLCLPLTLRKQIARKMRAASKKHTDHAPIYTMDVNQAEVIKGMKEHQVDYLIHGHTHKPAIHQFDVGSKNYTRIVLGAWHHKASVLVWYANGTKELIGSHNVNGL